MLSLGIVHIEERDCSSMERRNNGEKKQESTVAQNKDIDFMDSGHSVYDIGLKRDSGTVEHAYFSDLMVVYRELQFSPSENVNEIKSVIFLTHPLYNFV